MVQNIHAHKGDHVFFLNASRISLSPASQGGPFHVRFVRTSMDSKSQDATKITSALADSRICSSVKMVTLDIHMNAIIIFSVSHLLFSSIVVAMTTSRLTGVCMTSNDAPGISSWRLRLPILRRLIEGKKGTTILTLKVKVKTVTGLAQRTNGVVCSIYHIISLIHWAGIAGIYVRNWTQQVYQQLVSLLFALLLWNVRPPRNMCGEVVYNDLGWMNGDMCHDVSDAIKPTPSIVAWVQPKSRTMCVKWLARFKEGATIHAVRVLVHDHPAAGVQESPSDWLEEQPYDSQAWPQPSSLDASVGESAD